MLWLALYFPQLQLDEYLAQQTQLTDQPIIIIDPDKYQVVQCCALARKKGIQPGGNFAQACLLADHAKLILYRPEAAQKHIKNMAQSLYQVCADIVLDGSDGLVLRCDRMLSYYQDAQVLEDHLKQHLQVFNYHYQSAAACSYVSARLLARYASNKALSLQTKQAAEKLKKLPLSCLPLTDKQLKSLTRLGFKSVYDLQRLPSHQTGRHLGAHIQQLVSSLTTDPQAPSYYQPEQHFKAELELTYEISHADALLFPTQRLFNQLQNYLTRRAAITAQLSLTLHFREHAKTDIQIASQQPSSQASLWLELVKYKLENMQLNAPVIRLSLRCQQLIDTASNQKDLFTQQHQHTKQTLFARLNSRCKNIFKLALVKDYRLAYASKTQAWFELIQAPDNAQLFSQLHQGPLYLSRLHPVDKSSLTLLAGPQRLVTHWWAKQPQKQDYFYALNHHNQYIRLVKTADNQWYQDALFA